MHTPRFHSCILFEHFHSWKLQKNTRTNSSSYQNKMCRSNMAWALRDRNVVLHFENMQLYRSMIETSEDLLLPRTHFVETATTFCLLSILSLVDRLKRLSKRLQSITFYFSTKKKIGYFHTCNDFAYSKSFFSSSIFNILFIVSITS